MLCSLDFFLETRCKHLFCVQCFKEYLKDNGHNDEISDESNYGKLYHPVRCPVSDNILLFKHTKGSVYLKMKKFLFLTQYKVKCEYYTYGCDAVCRTSKLRFHYMECFFTSKRIQINRPPDFYTNNLYERLETNLLDGFELKKDGSLINKNFISSSMDKNLELISLIKDDDSLRYESVDDFSLYHKFKNSTNKNNELIDFNDTQSLSKNLINENRKLKDSTISLFADQDAESLAKLKEQLNNLQKNVDYIKTKVLPHFEK